MRGLPRAVLHALAAFTPALQDLPRPGASATLVVRAHDPTDPELPAGKQLYWYTPTSGIWQTVWLEARPEAHIAEAQLVPRRTASGEWSLDVRAWLAGAAGPCTLRCATPDPDLPDAELQVPAAAPQPVQLTLDLGRARPWHPDDPMLHDLVLELEAPGGSTDRVHTYFGLRTVERGRWGDLPHELVLLNGEPIFLRGALDQSFNPGGVYTAPGDDFLRRDLELAKAAGFNCLRVHIKPDEPRRLYWADRLGVLLLQDMPNCWAQSPRARQAWERTAAEAVRRDRNHPAIIAWVLFNETWGLGDAARYREDHDAQAWVERMWHAVRDLDLTRLVEDNSPCNYDHARTDLNSWHFYRIRPRLALDHSRSRPRMGAAWLRRLAVAGRPRRLRDARHARAARRAALGHAGDLAAHGAGAASRAGSSALALLSRRGPGGVRQRRAAPALDRLGGKLSAQIAGRRGERALLGGPQRPGRALHADGRRTGRGRGRRRGVALALKRRPVRRERRASAPGYLPGVLARGGIDLRPRGLRRRHGVQR